MRCSNASAALASALALALLCAAGAARAEPAPAALTVQALLARFAAMPGLEARFREEKRIALLEAPLVSEGVLNFAPPGILARRTTAPAASTVLIRDGQLRFSEGGRRGQLDLEANPLVRHFVESFVLLLAGDEAALRRLYDVTLRPRPEGGAEGWEMLLRPRPEAMRRVLREVELQGDGVVLARMRVLEVSGDETVTTFTAVDPARSYSPEERERLFRLPGP